MSLSSDFPVKVGVGPDPPGVSLPFFAFVFGKLVSAMENNIMIAIRLMGMG